MPIIYLRGDKIVENGTKYITLKFSVDFLEKTNKNYRPLDYFIFYFILYIIQFNFLMSLHKSSKTIKKKKSLSE